MIPSWTATLETNASYRNVSTVNLHHINLKFYDNFSPHFFFFFFFTKRQKKFRSKFFLYRAGLYYIYNSAVITIMSLKVYSRTRITCLMILEIVVSITFSLLYTCGWHVQTFFFNTFLVLLVFVHGAVFFLSFFLFLMIMIISYNSRHIIRTMTNPYYIFYPIIIIIIIKKLNYEISKFNS